MMMKLAGGSSCLTSFVLLAVAGPLLAQAGVPLGAEFRVNTFTTSTQYRPKVASASSGNFVVVWMSYPQDGSSYGIVGQRYASSGAPVGGEFLINTYTTDQQRRPSVASDPSGNFVVVWESRTQDGDSYGVFGQRYASSGAPAGTEFRVNTYTTNRQGFPDVASDSSGNFVVVWHSQYQDGSGYGVFAQRYASSGAALGGEFLVNTFTTDSQRFPGVTSDPSGNFVVVWMSYGIGSFVQDGSAYGIFGQRYASSGAPAGTEFRVNTYTTNVQINVSLASGASGDFVVVWRSNLQDGSTNGVFGQRYGSSGAPAGGEFRVNTFTTSQQAFPRVASDPSGNFVVVWESNSQDGDSYGVFGQRYASSGALAGAEFMVNTYTTNAQFSPSVAADPSGNFVVVWQSYRQDGSTEGIFGQRYGKILPVELTRFTVE